MGEYADEFFREEIQREYGFDPGSMYERGTKKKNQCPRCGKKFCSKEAMQMHLRDKHGQPKENSHD